MSPRARTAMEAPIIDTLNRLLEDERAGVETLVALSSMATDSLERQALTVMGGQAVQACGDLHERLEKIEVPITSAIGGAARQLAAYEHLDERYRAFGQLQQRLADQIEALLPDDLDGQTQATLATLRAMHLAQAAWAMQRADEFAASRDVEPESAAVTRAPANPTAGAPDQHEPPPETASASVTTTPPTTMIEEPPAPEIAPAETSASGDGAAPPSEPSTSSPRQRRTRARWPAGELVQHDGDAS